MNIKDLTKKPEVENLLKETLTQLEKHKLGRGFGKGIFTEISKRSGKSYPIVRAVFQKTREVEMATMVWVLIHAQLFLEEFELPPGF